MQVTEVLLSGDIMKPDFLEPGSIIYNTCRKFAAASQDLTECHKEATTDCLDLREKVAENGAEAGSSR